MKPLSVDRIMELAGQPAGALPEVGAPIPPSRLEPSSVNRQLYANSPLAGSSVEDKAAGNTEKLFNQKDPNLAILHEKPEHRIIIIYKAQCLSNREIAAKTGYTEPWISQVLRQPWAREALLDELRKSGRDEVNAVLQSEALNSIYKIVEIRDTALDKGVQLRSCQDLLDRHLGKPTQRVETRNESVVLSGDVADIDARLKRLKEEEMHLSGAPIL